MLFLLLYSLVGLINISAEYLGLDWLKYPSKILLMPLLAAYFYQQIKGVKIYRFIFLAMFFSWLGDIFLMFPKSSVYAKLFFIAGLVSFLIGHLNYIIHFIKEIKSKINVSIIVEKPYLVLSLIIFIVLLLRLLFPTLGSMKLPVIVYSLVISLMLMMAFNRKNLVSSTSFMFVFVGALLFVFSDSCIAINLFYKPFELARLLIMSTYIIAQFLIIKGILIEREIDNKNLNKV